MVYWPIGAAEKTHFMGIGKDFCPKRQKNFYKSFNLGELLNFSRFF